MKLLMISTDRRAFVAGSDSQDRLKELSQRLESLTVIVFTLRSHRLKPLKIGSLWLYPTNSLSRWFYALSAYRLARNLELPEVITAQDPFETGWAAAKLARKFRVPWQLQVHTSLFAPNFIKEGLLNRIRVWLARVLLPQADRVRVVSKEIADSFLAAGIELKRPVVVLPVFVDVEKIRSQPVTFDLRSRFPRWKKIVLMASRLSREKDFPLALSAFKIIASQNEEVGLVIVGEGPERPTIEKLVKTAALEGRVALIGWIDNLAPFYRGADVFLLTSRYEGFNRTLVEARLFDLPAVATKVGGAIETGARIIAPEPDLIAQAVKEALARQPMLKPFQWWSREEYWKAYLAALPK